MRSETPYADVARLLTGHERREGSWCWRPHGTPTPLLIHTRSGGAVLGIGGGEHAVASGDTVFWAPGAPQDFGSPTGSWEIIWAHFRPPPAWHDWLAWPSLGTGVARIPAPPERVRERIQAALLDMDRYARSTMPREAVLFVAENLDRAIGVKAIAEAVHLSPSRLTHLFTEQIGTPPARFVEQRRIERAKALLESSSLPIGAIAEAAGFSSQYYFAARFRAVVGITPSQWRRRSRRTSTTAG